MVHDGAPQERGRFLDEALVVPKLRAHECGGQRAFITDAQSAVKLGYLGIMYSWISWSVGKSWVTVRAIHKDDDFSSRSPDSGP